MLDATERQILAQKQTFKTKARYYLWWRTPPCSDPTTEHVTCALPTAF